MNIKDKVQSISARIQSISARKAAVIGIAAATTFTGGNMNAQENSNKNDLNGAKTETVASNQKIKNVAVEKDMKRSFTFGCNAEGKLLVDIPGQPTPEEFRGYSLNRYNTENGDYVYNLTDLKTGEEVSNPRLTKAAFERSKQLGEEIVGLNTLIDKETNKPVEGAGPVTLHTDERGRSSIEYSQSKKETGKTMSADQVMAKIKASQLQK